METNFKDIFGHQKQLKLLENELRRNQLSHAYLFTGNEGIGKRTVAEAFALKIVKSGLFNKNRKISLNHADIFRIGYENENITIKDIREVINQTSVHPLEGTYRVFIIDHAENINNIAQNALLKTIEEPLEGNIFILVTNSPHKILQTIKSRSQELIFHDLSYQEKVKLLEKNQIPSEKLDLNKSPGELIKEFKNPEYYEKLEKVYTSFLEILNGSESNLFSFAEEAAESKEFSLDILTYIIQKLSKQILVNKEVNFNIIRIINELFELLEKLSYNVNLRLQWECSLIQISMEPN